MKSQLHLQRLAYLEFGEQCEPTHCSFFFKNMMLFFGHDILF